MAEDVKTPPHSPLAGPTSTPTPLGHSTDVATNQHRELAAIAQAVQVPSAYAAGGELPPFDYAKIIEQIKYTDSHLAEHLNLAGLNVFSAYGGAPGSKALDPDLYGRQLIETGKELAAGGWPAKFMLEQTVLHGLNEETSRIFDPAYFVNRAPLLNSFKRMTIDKTTHADFAEIKNIDVVRGSKNGIDNIDNPKGDFIVSQSPLGQATADFLQVSKNVLEDYSAPLRELETKNPYTPNKKYSDGADFTIGGLVDAALEKEAPADDPSAAAASAKLLVNVGIDGNVTRKRVDASLLFEPSTTKLEFTPTAASRNKTGAIAPRSSKLANSAFPNGIIPANFPGEDEDGLFRSEGAAKPKIDDDTAYVPLSFTDMRASGNQYRTIYFRPFITSLNESLAPSWNETNYFGRVDPVMTYSNTTRTFSFAFGLHAFSPEDLQVIYKKLFWLKSLVYPEYTPDLLMKSGPVCRLRIGDVVRSGGQGLPGVITALDFDYTDSIWELKKDYKVPRHIQVSVSFTVLHDAAIGIVNGRFGGHVADYIETPGDKELEPEEQTTTGYTVNLVRGSFSDFGES